MNTQPSNIIPITPAKKKRGNPNINSTVKASGPRINEPAHVDFKKEQYYLPGGIEKGLAGVTIHRDEIFELGLIAATWEDIEDFFCVSQDDIKKYYDRVYRKGLATYKITKYKKMNELGNAGSVE